MPSTTTEAPRQLPTLPTDDEIADADRLLQKMHDEMESITWRTRGFSQLFEGDRVIPDVLPTRADVGRLYLFAHYLETRSWELGRMSKQIVEALPLLGEMSANVAIYEARGASDDV